MRHLGLIAVCACILASVGCDGGTLTAPEPPEPPRPPSSDPITMVMVEFGGRVVNADAGGPVGNVRVSVQSVGFGGREPAGWVFPKDTATSGGDGTFTLPFNLPSVWKFVSLQLTGPPGYDGGFEQFEAFYGIAGRTGVEIKMYPTLVIRPGESIDVRVDVFQSCGFAGDAGFCRRVLVAASPGDPVELELVPYDSSKPMGLSPDAWGAAPVSRLMVDPGSFPYLIGAGTARLTARR
jgi:hypothetical protein